MPIIDIKSAFDGEVNFYKAVLSNEPYKRALMRILDITDTDDFVPDIRTQDGKYADAVLYDKNEEAYMVLEFQLGFLDSIHACKIIYYMYSQGVDYGVLICEDVSEDIRDYVKDLNAHGYSIGILRPIIVKDSSRQIEVQFTWLLRPVDNEAGAEQKASAPRNKEAARTKYPRSSRLLIAQQYYANTHDEQLNDYDHQSLGKCVRYGSSTYLTMIFNSVRNSVELSVYEGNRHNEAYCNRLLQAMNSIAQKHQTEVKSVPTKNAQHYQINLGQNDSEEKQAQRTADVYFEVDKLIANIAPIPIAAVNPISETADINA